MLKWQSDKLYLTQGAAVIGVWPALYWNKTKSAFKLYDAPRQIILNPEGCSNTVLHKRHIKQKSEFPVINKHEL
jgi:hypothetical protein